MKGSRRGVSISACLTGRAGSFVSSWSSPVLATPPINGMTGKAADDASSRLDAEATGSGT